MLRAILAAVCAALFIHSPSLAKKPLDERIPTITSPPSGPTDGFLASDARFAMAAANTTVLYTANFDNGALCNTQGWTTHDVQTQVGTFWHVDDFVGANVNPGDSYAPIAGAKSLWCGARASTTGEICGYLELPGYGNTWDQAWRTKTCIGVAGDLDVSFAMHLNSEPGYDPLYLQYTDDCDADYREPWTTLAGGISVWDGSQDVSHAAAYNVGSGPVRVRLRFASDGAFSDADGNFDSHSGPVVIDNLAVEGLAVETFEGETVGATSSNDWEADIYPGFGSHFALFPGAALLQQDACAKNLSCVWAAISGSTATYACGGFPQQAAVPVGNAFGQYINESIVSPPIPLTGNGSRLDLQFSVYRDLSLTNLVFYFWDVRSIVDGCPGPWRSRNFAYNGDQKDWHVDVFPMGDLIDLANASHIQVRLGVFDRCIASCGIMSNGDCHSHAPLFDSVRVSRIDINGPVWSTRDIDMFQDTFPTDGSDTGIGRADAALSITSQATPTILPGDSVRVIVSDPLTAVAVTNPSGLLTDNLGGNNGNKACYVYVHVIDSGVPSVTKTGAVLSGGPSYPFKDTVVADGKTWTRIQCWLRLSSGNLFVVDLNDNLFEAGDEIEFFFGATNTNGETSYCSGSALNYVQSDLDVAAAAASEFTILPLTNGLPNALYVDGMDGRGAQVFWDTAFEQISITPDRYDVRGPTSAVSNRPSTRVVDVNQQLNANYQGIVWDCGDLSVGLGDGTGVPEKSNDYAMINSFLGGITFMGGVFICGDDAAQSLTAATGASATTFKATFATYTLTTGDHRVSFGTSPLVTGVAGGLYASQTFVAFGGCPLLNDFDVMAPTGSATMAMAYGIPASTNGAVTNKLIGNARVILAGFSFIYIRDDEQDGVMDRAKFLHSTLNVFNLDGPQPTDAPPLAVNRLEQNYPNPFNPQTTIAFSIKERGRVRIDVFNVAGERVTELLDATRAAGSYSDVRWDGTDASGTRVASGVYWYRITAGSFSQSRKMVLLK